MKNNTYVFIDIEAASINGRQHIIEIGAIKLSPEKEIEQFSQLVKPTHFKKLSTNIQTLTGITNEEIMNGKSFRSVIKEFISWCGEDTIFVTFGDFDRRILEMELERNHIKKDFLYPIVDFQQKYMIENNLKDQPSLLNLLEELNIPIEIHHRALSDAYSLMKLFQALNGESLIKKQQTNDFILLLAEWKQSEENCHCILTYASGTISSKLTIQSIRTMKKKLSIKLIEDKDEETIKQQVEPDLKVAQFLQDIIKKMDNKVLITRSNMKTISRICRIHDCILPKTECVSLQTLLKDQEKVNQFLINNLSIKDYKQKICYLMNEYSYNIKEEFLKRHLFRKDKITI